MVSCNPDDYIFLSDGVKYWVGRPCDIISLEVSGNYTTIRISNGQTLVVRGALGKWEAKLPPSLFFKAGRDCMINLRYVTTMRAYDSKRLSLVLVGGNEVIMSRQQSVLFRRQKSL